MPTRGPAGPGPYMAQNPGIRDAAFQVLTRASGNRNVKLCHVAAAVSPPSQEKPTSRHISPNSPPDTAVPPQPADTT